MGRIKTAQTKRYAREALSKYEKDFTTDFEHNKQVLNKVSEIQSKKIRNTVAGYIVRLVKNDKY